jgi:hypothetical protein
MEGSRSPLASRESLLDRDCDGLSSGGELLMVAVSAGGKADAVAVAMVARGSVVIQVKIRFPKNEGALARSLSYDLI